MSDQPQILFINQTLGMGGAETYDAELLAELQHTHGYQVHAFVTYRRFKELLKKKNLTTTQTRWVVDIVGNWKGLLKAVVTAPLAFFEYSQLLSRYRTVAVVILSSFSEKILVSPLAAWYGIPVVWLEFGPVTPLFEKFGGLPRFLYNWATQFVARVVVPSQFTKTNILAETSHAFASVHVLPCGVTALKATQPAIPHEIVCVSRMEAGKGQELLVKAFAEVHKRFPDSHLTFVGEGDHTRVVEEAVRAHGLEHAVSLLGYVPDISTALSQASVCVFPSLWPLEGFGMVMIEALSVGRPVVAFARGPAVEIIQDKKTGLLAVPGDTHDLAQKILWLFEHPASAASVAKAGKKEYEAHYTIAAVANQYATLLHSLKHAQ